MIKMYFDLNREDLEGPRLEFPDADFVQLTYEGLRVGPDGEHVAYFDHKDGCWHVDNAYADNKQAWSDVTIWQA